MPNSTRCTDVAERFSVDPDRRAHRRTTLDRPVHLETRDRTATVRSLDVGAGGLSVQTHVSLAIGERVTVYFELPIGFGVETEAEVVRSDEGRVALRFVDIPRESALAIRSFCRVSGLMPAIKPPSTPRLVRT